MDQVLVPFLLKDFNAKQLKYGFASLNGEVVISAMYDEVQPFSENKSFVRINDLWGCIDPMGQFVLPIQYSGVSQPFIDNIAVVQKANLWCAIDNYGNEVIPFRYRLSWKFNSDKAWVPNEKDKFGLIDREGNVLIDFLFDEVLNPGSTANEPPFRHILIIGEKVGASTRYGLLSMCDHIVIVPCIYDSIRHYDCALFMVRTNKKYGVITEVGTLVIPPIYDEVFVLDNNRCLAILAKTFFLIDGSGRLLLQLNDMQMKICEGGISHGLILAYQNGKYGYLNFQLEVTIPFIYANLHTAIYKWSR